MPSARLQQQFIRLWQCCEGKSQEHHAQRTGSVTELLASSYAHPAQHHAGSRLADVEAEVGRGKRSRLTFLYTGLALQQQRAEDLLEQDRIDQLVQLVGDKATVRQMLVSHLGRSFRQGGTSCACSTIVRCVICYLAAHCAVLKPISPGKSSVR